MPTPAQTDFQPPHLINFPNNGRSEIGFLSIAENGSSAMPFDVERVVWTYHTPESVVRGRHAHYHTEQILIAVSGRIIVTTENGWGEVQTFVLDSPKKGLYVPPNVWHTMQYSHTAVQLILASTRYEESDYIRDYEAFKTTHGPQT